MPRLKGDDAIRTVLTNARTIAVVGHSDKPERTSYQIAQFLRVAGYLVYPVNPQVQQIDGEPSYPSLKDLPEAVDIVNVFRRSEFLPNIVEDAIAVNAKTVWAQLGVVHAEAEARAIAAGINIITNACIKVEYQRLRIQQLQ
uniref:CoA-binding protein n=1 Tax=Oscillatoriales cyanobacterium SpSt-402 TaxID=2282168 RepID=A0A832H4H5_9CYAN